MIIHDLCCCCLFGGYRFRDDAEEVVMSIDQQIEQAQRVLTSQTAGVACLAVALGLFVAVMVYLCRPQENDMSDETWDEDTSDGYVSYEDDPIKDEFTADQEYRREHIDFDPYSSYEDYDDYGNEDREVDFADPGGRSALRAATPSNPRIYPCPDCGAENRLTRKDVELRYCCNQCADRNERGGY